VRRPGYRLASTDDLQPIADEYETYVDAAAARGTAGGGLQILGAHEVAQ
jgi:hypothetical protein